MEYLLGGKDGGVKNTIGNIKITDTTDNVGLFASIGSNAIIKNLKIQNSTSTGTNNVGMLVGNNTGKINDIEIINCTITGTENTGGLIGKSEKIFLLETEGISNISINGCTIKGQYNTGGIVGYNKSNIINCGVESGTIEGVNVPIKSLEYITDYDIINNIDNNFGTGGIVGFNYLAKIFKSYNKTNISGQANLGGIAGATNGGKIYECFNKGIIEKTGSNNNNEYSDLSALRWNRLGGIVAVIGNNAKIKNCYNTGDVKGVSYSNKRQTIWNWDRNDPSNLTRLSQWLYRISVGGIVGTTTETNWLIENCYSTGTIEGGREGFAPQVINSANGGIFGINNQNIFLTQDSIRSYYLEGNAKGRSKWIR